MTHQSEPVAGPELLLSLERHARAALHEQLERTLRDLVRSGRLAPGSRLPSSRALAGRLGVSRGVVLEAYSQLAAEGYLTASQGAPTRVAQAASVERPPQPASSLERRPALDLRPGVPDLAAFPRERWMRSLRAALADSPLHAIGPADVRGAEPLRNELMGFLARARGAAPEPEHTIVCTGFAAAFAMLCRVLYSRGVERIAVEDPGWPQHRLIAERAGLEAVPVPVDLHGLDVAGLAAADCEVVVLTPSHQFPTGTVLSPDRRAALLEWAEDRDALIVEDDYDSELRYDRVAVGALQGLAPERVCAIGSLSKRLAPGVRIGWMLSPSWLTGELTYENGASGGGCGVLEQLALADFIARGELERHLRRTRLRYRRRRALLTGALSFGRAIGVAAGLHVTVTLPDGVGEERVIQAASEHGIAVDGLSWHPLSDPSFTAVVIGFGNIADAAMPRALRLLDEAVRASMS